MLRRRMQRTPDGLGTKQFIQVLLLLEKARLEELSAAVEYAMGLGIADADTIRVMWNTEPCFLLLAFTSALAFRPACCARV